MQDGYQRIQHVDVKVVRLETRCDRKFIVDEKQLATASHTTILPFPETLDSQVRFIY